MATEIKNQLPIFNGKNYTLWKFKLKALLTASKLWDIITEVGKPAEKADKFATWQESADKVTSIIVTSVNNIECAKIVNARTPKEMIDIYDAQYINKSVQNKILLKKQLHTLKMQEGGDLQAHLAAVDTLFAELSSIGADTVDEDRVIILMVSLPESYANVIQALELMPNLSYQAVKNALTNSDLLRKAGTTAPNTTMYTRDQCQRPLPRPPATKNRSTQERNTDQGVVCEFCGGKGHNESRCYTKRKFAKQAQRERKEKTTSGKNTESQSEKTDDKTKKKDSNFFTVETCLLTAAHDGWYMDCATTRHICNSKEAFTELRPVNDTVIQTGGGAVEAEGVGTARVLMDTGDGELTPVNLSNTLYSPKFPTNLLSVGRAQQKGATFTVGNDLYKMYDRDQLVAIGQYAAEGLFHIKCTLPERESAMTTNVTSATNASPNDGDLPTDHSS